MVVDLSKDGGGTMVVCVLKIRLQIQTSLVRSILDISVTGNIPPSRTECVALA
jgi:hypothetical protein